MRPRLLFTHLISLLCLTLAARTNAAAEAIEPALAKSCQICHGGELQLGDPPYSVPHLVHQNAAYLTRALQAYKSGARRNTVMQGVATRLSRQDIEALSSWFAGTRVKPPPPNSSGTIPELVIAQCSACHGETGLSSMPEVAVLSGQRADYLEHALQAYASGERRDAVMPALARPLTAADRAELAAYFSASGALQSRP